MSSNVKIMAGATVCEDCVLEGDITIGAESIVHPRANIIAEGGPIIIADYCILEEYSTIIHKKREGEQSESGVQKPLIIGAHNVFEVGSRLESYAGFIGDSNVFECKSLVGADVTIGSGCVIGAGVHLTSKQDLGDKMVIWGGAAQYSREALDKQPSQYLQLDFLSKVMPNYHRIRKPNVHIKKQES